MPWYDMTYKAFLHISILFIKHPLFKFASPNGDLVWAWQFPARAQKVVDKSCGTQPNSKVERWLGAKKNNNTPMSDSFLHDHTVFCKHF